ncbi:MAG: sigma 54-interacting transcriptional regulator, partial [Candidatus Zixiibacteriota bacterium]
MSQAVRTNITYRASCIKYLSDLIDRREFTAAIKYYESIQAGLNEQRDFECGIVLRLAAKAFGSSNQYKRALQLIRIAIAILSKMAGETGELAECYLVLGEILRDIGKFGEAEKAFRDGESIFRRGENHADAGRALNKIAGILFRKGDFDGSLQCLLEAVEAARKENNQKQLAYLFGNIGRVYTLLGRLNAAEDNIRLNIELSSEFSDEVELARAYLSLGYVQMQLMNYGTAGDSLEQALQFIRKNGMTREEVIYLTYAGELALKTDALDQAEHSLNEAYRRGHQIAPESLLVARPLRHLAQLFLVRGSYRKAMSFANRSLAMMNAIDDAIEIGALHRIRAVCYDNLNRKNAAGKAYRNSIAILEEHQARFELADSLAAAGRSSVFRLNQQAMYLCRAEELYDNCNIQPKVREMQICIGDCEVTKAPLSATSGAVGTTIVDFPTKNRKMRQIVDQLRLLRQSDLPILLTGETGTGKDFLARYFHSIARPQGPYIAVNCAAVPDTLIESELFGYQRGAFTGADASKTGLFLAANHGVLLLDEVGELPPATQAKLLSVLETKKLRPLGTADEVDLDIIVIAATNRNLEEMAENGSFRRDLYYRL